MVVLAFLKLLPRFFLWILAFLFGLLIYWGDKIAFFLLRISKRSQYVRRGTCQKTGMCCRNLALEIPRFTARRPWFRKGVQAWYRAIFNFHPVGVLYENWLVFECHYLTKDNLCGIYPYRPKLCREFPLTTLFGHSRLHKGCGFWFVKRSEQGTFREKIADQAHEQERSVYTNPGLKKE